MSVLCMLDRAGGLVVRGRCAVCVLFPLFQVTLVNVRRFAELCICVKYMALHVVRTNVIYVRKIRTNSWIKLLFSSCLYF